MKWNNYGQNSYESLTMTKRRNKKIMKKEEETALTTCATFTNSVCNMIHKFPQRKYPFVRSKQCLLNTATCSSFSLHSSNFFLSIRCFFLCRFPLISIEFPHSNGNHWSNAHFVEIHFAFEPLYIAIFTPSPLFLTLDWKYALGRFFLFQLFPMSLLYQFEAWNRIFSVIFFSFF